VLWSLHQQKAIVNNHSDNKENFLSFANKTASIVIYFSFILLSTATDGQQEPHFVDHFDLKTECGSSCAFIFFLFLFASSSLSSSSSSYSSRFKSYFTLSKKEVISSFSVKTFYSLPTMQRPD